MGKFLEKLCSFLVNLIVIGLILLVSVQIVMKDETANQYLQNIEMTIKNIFFQQEKTIEVSGTRARVKTGLITIDLLQNLSLPQVWLLCNGERVANFADGVVVIEVRDGDLLKIDSSFYSESLWFEITSISSTINTWKTGEQFRTAGNVLYIGRVELKNKL